MKTNLFDFTSPSSSLLLHDWIYYPLTVFRSNKSCYSPTLEKFFSNIYKRFSGHSQILLKFLSGKLLSCMKMWIIFVQVLSHSTNGTSTDLTIT